MKRVTLRGRGHRRAGGAIVRPTALPPYRPYRPTALPPYRPTALPPYRPMRFKLKWSSWMVRLPRASRAMFPTPSMRARPPATRSRIPPKVA